MCVCAKNKTKKERVSRRFILSNSPAQPLCVDILSGNLFRARGVYKICAVVLGMCTASVPRHDGRRVKYVFEEISCFEHFSAFCFILLML